MGDNLKQTQHTPSKLKEPNMYQVIFLNDDFTPMDFVSQVIRDVFGKTSEEAEAIMLQVHQKGKAVVGTYTKDIAETKKHTVDYNSELFQHPLRVELLEIT